MISFFMVMDPPTITQQEHKVRVVKGKPMFYEPQELKAAKKKLLDSLVWYIPDQMFECGVRLTVKWLFHATEKHCHGSYRITKPDTDNLQKMLKDCMTKLRFWKDDALVASEIVEKMWSDVPGIYIRIEELKNG